MTRFVGISAEAHTGKDTVARILLKQFQTTGQKWGIRALADPIKEGLIAMLGLSHEQLYTDKLKEIVDEFWGYSPRWLMQKVGDDFLVQQFMKDVWIKTPAGPFGNFARKHDGVIIPDARRPFEAEAIRKKGGYIIRLIRPDAPKVKNGILGHNTETEQAGIVGDYTIVNDGSVVALEAEAQNIARMLILRFNNPDF